MNTKLNSLFIIIFSVSITCNYATEKNTSLNKGKKKVSGYENTKVYTIFFDQGSYLGGGTELLESKNFTTNKKLLHKLRSKCNGIDFIAKDMTNSNISIKKVYSELESSKENIDGVLLIGDIHGEYRLAFTGLPTIVVYNLFSSLHTPYKLYATGKEEESIFVGGPDYKNGKILTAELDRGNITASAEGMFEDLVYKIKLIQTIKKLKESRILRVSTRPYFSIDNYHGHDSQKFWPKDHNERYARTLKEKLGVEIVTVNPEEFYAAYKESNQKEAEEIAEKWIEGAQKVIAAKSEIIKNARAYLAFDALREKYNCNAVSTIMRSLTGSGDVKDIFFPGLGFECGFKTRGIQATCQDHIDMTVTEIVGYFLTGKPSMLGDLMIDRYNSTAILTHCGAPINPYGDERRVPYIIKSHAQSPVRDTKKPGSGTGLDVKWPVGKPVTFWMFNVLNNKIGVFTGKTVDADMLYKHLDDIGCRTKVIAKVDNIKAVQNHQSPDEYGIHRIATLGDLREKIKDFAILIGFDVMETDR